MLLTDDVQVSPDSTFDFSNCAKFMINSTTSYGSVGTKIGIDIDLPLNS